MIIRSVSDPRAGLITALGSLPTPKICCKLSIVHYFNRLLGRPPENLLTAARIRYRPRFMRKFLLIAAPVVILAAAPLFAQNESQAAAAAAVAVQAGTPQAQVDRFFGLLIEGRVDAAYDQLLQGTKIAESTKDVEMLKEKTRAALRAFGDVSGVDQINVRNVGTRLQRITSLSLGARFPIRWRFYFYQAADKWRLIDLRIDDRLADMFEEPAPVLPTAPAPAK
ncbi:MAG: hypothetical protein WCH57_05590 [Verrucomicrobiota bacterium]